jgi:general secretion pathway protein C
MMKVLNRHFWVVHVVFVACVAWLASYLSILLIQDRIVSLPRANAARKSPPAAAIASEPYDRYSPVTERNIFSPEDRGQKLLPLMDKRSPIPAGGKTGPNRGSSPGNYILMGTITGPGGHSWAILQEKGSRKQQFFRMHGNVDGGRIVKVSRDQIQIEREGKRETLTLSVEETASRPAGKLLPPPRRAHSKGPEVKRLSANRFLVNREDVTAAVGNINQFMTQARLRPHFEMGKPSGYAVSEVVPGSLMEKLGLKNNDIIKKVNGLLVTRPEEVMQAYAQLQRDSNIEVEVERGGRTEVLRYEIR